MQRGERREEKRRGEIEAERQGQKEANRHREAMSRRLKVQKRRKKT